MISKSKFAVGPMKALNCSYKYSNKWMFPSGINYFSIARAERDASGMEDSLKWMIPSGVNYKPR